MDLAALNASARNLMVDSQVRPNRVYDARILDAMRRLPRERFLPPALAARAYADEDVPLGNGRFLTEPLVIARLVQLAEPRPRERALVVAAGAGYAAALLAACAAQVTALEADPALLALARAVLPALAPSVRLVEGPLDQGSPAQAPYDVILIDGAVEQVPDALVRQLRPTSPHGGGRLVTAHREGAVCHGVLGDTTGAGLRLAPAFDCATPTLPAFRKAPGFVF